jgi:hypothetical protein
VYPTGLAGCCSELRDPEELLSSGKLKEEKSSFGYQATYITVAAWATHVSSFAVLEVA